MELLLAEVVVLITAPFIRRYMIPDPLIGACTQLVQFVKMLTLGLVTEASQWWVMFLFIYLPRSLIPVAIRTQISKVRLVFRAPEFLMQFMEEQSDSLGTDCVSDLCVYGPQNKTSGVGVCIQCKKGPCSKG